MIVVSRWESWRRTCVTLREEVGVERGVLVLFFFLSRREASYIRVGSAPVKRNEFRIQERVEHC